MTLNPRALKITSGVATLAVCGVSGVIVAADAKPTAAPLHPPVAQATPRVSQAALTVPPTCGSRVKRSACRSASGGSPATGDPERCGRGAGHAAARQLVRVVITPIAAFTRHAFTAFGSAACEVVACGVAEDEVSAAVAETYAFESQLTRFDVRSELSRFNNAAGRFVAVTPLLETLLRAALDAFMLSDGLVNAACHSALIAAGYDMTITAIRRRAEPVLPKPARSVPSLPEVLDVRAGEARLARGCAVDLGGVGKGWLADSLCERFDNGVVNLGGDLRARGDGPDGLGWSVGLCDGRAVYVREAGVATSGTSGRHWAGGHHLIDPRTGRPARTDAAAISVVAGNAFTAEVLAKAACVLGSDEAASWLRRHGALRHAAIWARTVQTV